MKLPVCFDGVRQQAIESQQSLRGSADDVLAVSALETYEIGTTGAKTNMAPEGAMH
ncbi:hypothetical protein [Duganella sp. S19_KUP01_CR8]|uniref:hypothetical protein n=1 Tax=Duganella sp. S19_KUP01_CR8 TaxID=3025502 RepID=UPI002FCDB8B8